MAAQSFNYGIVRSYAHVWDEATQTWIPQVRPGAPGPELLSRAVVDLSASGDQIVIAGAVGETIRVYRLLLAAASLTTVQIKSGLTPLSGALTLLALVLDFDPEPWFVTASGDDFVLALGGAVQVSGTVYYSQQAP
jgi:hypothetical protein